MMCGVLRGRERLEALADADVVAYAGEHEVFGLVALEAVLCGTPVVVADDSGSGEILAAIGGGRAVPPGDAAALADALDEILRNKAVWRAAAGEAAPRARQRFGSDQICAQLEAVYEEVISETRPGRTFGTSGTSGTGGT
jgi:glycosyltransferase involved in cell wall biosynthesis